jgi:hypothetical protein
MVQDLYKRGSTDVRKEYRIWKQGAGKRYQKSVEILAEN